MQEISLKRLIEMSSEIVEKLDREGSVLIIGAGGQSLGVLIDRGEYENLRAIAELVSTKEGIESIIFEGHGDRELVSAEEMYDRFSNS